MVGYIEKKGKQVLDSPKNISALRSETGMVFQNFNLFPHMTVLENIMEDEALVARPFQADCYFFVLLKTLARLKNEIKKRQEI